VSENRVLKRIFRTKREEVAGSWRKLRIARFRNLYSSRNINRMIKLRRMRLAEHGASVEEMRSAYTRAV
jgi:hypothetical protein